MLVCGAMLVGTLRTMPDRRDSMKPVSEATTAPASRRTLLARSGFLLVPPEVIVSPESRL